MTKKKNFYIENLGCAKNQVDAESLAAQFEQADWKSVEDPQDASLIIVNTCGFINPAKEESVDKLLEMKSSYPDARVIAAGCLSQRYADELTRSLSEIDGFIGNRDLSNVPARVEALLKSGEKLDNLSFLDPDETLKLGTAGEAESGTGSSAFRSKRMNPDGYAYVKIAEGCNHRCSYCAIPIIRGGVVSRPKADIVKEISLLAEAGVKEMELVAQDLFSYGTDKGSSDFIALLKAIFKLKQDFNVRLLYMHPDMFDEELLSLIESEPRLLPYLDIPFQHAATGILRSMGRRGTAQSYLEMVGRIRERLPQAVLRSTFLLGYPGETRKDLQTVEDFISRAKLDWAGFFVYSREEGTRASELTNKLKNSRNVKAARRFLPRLERLQQSISEASMEKMVGTTQSVLVEEAVEGEALYLGRCWFQAPEVDGLTVIVAEGLKPGDEVKCKIIKRNGIDLEAQLV